MGIDTQTTTIKMVVCDMAGTTVNEDNLVYKTLQQVLLRAGYNISLEQVLASGAGKEKKEALRSILADSEVVAGTETIDILYQDFLDALGSAYEQASITGQPRVLDFFAALRERHILIVLNTGYNRRTAEQLLQKLDWKIGHTIDALVTADDVQRGRPHPDMIYHAMRTFGISSAAQVAKIGDSTVDIEEGKNAGCKLSIGITTGAQQASKLQTAQPEYIVDNLIDIIPLLS